LGSSNQPVSGITICTFLLAALFLFAGRVSGPEAVKTLLLISGIVCLAACMSGTAAQNLKTTMMVGGTPKAIQAGLLVAVLFTSLIATPLLAFLDQAFTIGSKELLAPQAGMFSEMAKGLFIEGAAVPWGMVGWGCGLALALIGVGEVLRRRGSSFGVSPMAVAVGIYLPFTTTLPILLGGLVHWLVVRTEPDPARRAQVIQRGTVLCAGLVAGEALTGIFLAVPAGLGSKLPVPLVGSDGVRMILGAVVLLALPALLFWGMRSRSQPGAVGEATR
jgi:putative OPT family oligopeptide transporter